MKKTSGFTLIEIVITTTIIGILASTIMLSVGGAREKSRDAKRTGDGNVIVKAIKQYSIDNFNTYPHCTGTDEECGLSEVASATPAFLSYLPTIPTDPKSPGVYGAYNFSQYQYVNQYLALPNDPGFGILLLYENPSTRNGTNNWLAPGNNSGGSNVTNRCACQQGEISNSAWWSAGGSGAHVVAICAQ